MHPNDPTPKTAELTVIIPWVHVKTDAGYINEEFTDLDWGDVIKVDFVERDKVILQNGKINPKHYKVFIHFKNLTKEGKRVKTYLETTNDSEIKVNHYHGHWIVRQSNWRFNTSKKDKSIGKPKFEFI
jgi:hypothetical protein